MRQPGAGGRLLLPVRSPSALEHAGDIMPLFRGWNIVLRNHACVTIGSITGAAANAVQQHAHCLPMPMPQARPLGGAALQPLRRGQMPIPAPQLPATTAEPGLGGRRGAIACRGLFGLGLPEIAVIAGVAALIFGPSKLPELGKGLGKTVKSFQTAAKEFKTELEAAAADDSDSSKPDSGDKSAAGQSDSSSKE